MQPFFREYYYHFTYFFPVAIQPKKTRKTSQILPEHSIDRAAKSIRYQKLYSSGSTNKTNLICISPMSVLDNPPAGTHAPAPPPPSHLIAFPLQTHRASYRHTLHNFRLNRAHQEHATYFFELFQDTVFTKKPGTTLSGLLHPMGGKKPSIHRLHTNTVLSRFSLVYC